MYRIYNKKTNKFVGNTNGKTFWSKLSHIKNMLNTSTALFFWNKKEDLELIEYELVEVSRKPL